MKVLCFTPFKGRLNDTFTACGDAVDFTEDVPRLDFVRRFKPEIIVNYACPHIFGADVLSACEVINLHASLLPWNRGPHPNLWSWIDDTPKGVTIHYVDQGIDTGDIIAQRELFLDESETLASSHAKLLRGLETLFAEQWPLIRTGKAERRKQPLGGSSHSLKDRRLLQDLLPEDGNIPVTKLRALAHARLK